jgi:predicted DNA binding protein
MTTIVKAGVPTDQFALAETLEAVPAVEFEAIRFVSHSTDRVVPLLRATNADTDAVYDAIRADETTTDARLVSQRNHEALFQMHWTARVQFLTHVLVEERGAIVSARGSSDGWTFRILFPERDAVSSTYDACEEYEIDIEQISPLGEAPSLGRFHLTNQQCRAVQAAVDQGYYEVPRETTLEDLASDLGVSHQALSERLRRGHRTLIESVLAP